MLCHHWIVLLLIIIITEKKPLLPSNRRASCSRRGGQVKICKVHFFIFTACLLDKPRRVRPVKLQILHNYNVFYRDSINPQCVVGSPVNLLCTLLWETVETIYNIYIYIWEYKRTVSIINERMSSSLTNKTGSTFLFSNVFLGSSKDFILKLRGKLHFLKDNLYLYGYKLTKTKSPDISRYRKPTPVCSNNECLLWCCLFCLVSFNLFILLPLLLGLFCIIFFSPIFLDFSALKRICTKV